MLRKLDLETILQQAAVAGYSSVLPANWGNPNSRLGNPTEFKINTQNGVKKFRLWMFEVTFGGRANLPDEYRVQLTAGPDRLDQGGYRDILLGYHRETDTLVTYDRQYLAKYASPDRGASVSAQLNINTMRNAAAAGFEREERSTRIAGETACVAFQARFLPEVLINHTEIIQNTISIQTLRLSMTNNTQTSLQDFCRSKGFYFSDDILARYVSSLNAKPFVILAGVSGTGKTKIAQLTAEYFTQNLVTADNTTRGAGAVTTSTRTNITDIVITPPQTTGPTAATPSPEQIAFVPVRTDWSDSKAILGYFNPILEKYEPTDILILILHASKECELAQMENRRPKPFFIILDEMNLAKVEHYFSDFLSCLETRKQGLNGSIEQSPIRLHHNGHNISHQYANETLNIPETINIPLNVFITGTVNVDESTHSFSQKVLDRANVIEFSHVDLESYAAGTMPNTYGEDMGLSLGLDPIAIPNRTDYQSLDVDLRTHLQDLNKILEKANLQFGYRTAGEIGRLGSYLNRMIDMSNLDLKKKFILDTILLQKILPRLSGSRSRLEEPLLEFFVYLCNLDYQNPEELKSKTIDYQTGLIEGSNVDNALCSIARLRSAEMLRTLREFGFVTFFR